MELILTALLMGLMGAGHCVVMCGSLTTAVGFSIPAQVNYFVYSSIISLSRILGYVFIGVVVSTISQTIVSLTSGGVFYLLLLSSLLMLGVGLHVANVSSVILKTEKLGVSLNRIILPLKKKVMPINTISRCVGYGFLWGFLPCGMVYTAITLAISAPNVLNAGLIMFAFGLGTFPTLVGLTAFQSKLNRILANSYVRFALGSIIIVMAAYQFYFAIDKLSSIQ